MKWLLSSMFAVVLSLLSFDGVAGNMCFERLTAEQGLSQMSVNAVLQDKQGSMWFGTQDGLNRYDGYQFKIYRSDRDDVTSLASKWGARL
jgi:ligand-binding sensor domain-containing protein